MGLDMYLNRFPRYKWYRPENINAFEEWVEWKLEGKDKEYSLEKWCGAKESDLPEEEDRSFFEKLISTKYWEWDTEHRYPHDRIYEQVAYWRKANAVHKWFVDHVQDGEDDCEYHKEVTKKDLIELRDICREILENAVLVNGKVKNGYKIGKNGEEIPNWQDGKYVANPEVCAKLPTESGFFFGNQEFNEWYLEDIKYTFEVCNKVLEETDFEKQMIFYVSSW